MHDIEKVITLRKVGANIRKHREAKQFKQEYVGRKVGITKSHLSRLENGSRDTTIKKILLLAAFLEINPMLLFEK